MCEFTNSSVWLKFMGSQRAHRPTAAFCPANRTKTKQVYLRIYNFIRIHVYLANFSPRTIKEIIYSRPHTFSVLQFFWKRNCFFREVHLKPRDWYWVYVALIVGLAFHVVIFFFLCARIWSPKENATGSSCVGVKQWIKNMVETIFLFSASTTR